MNPDDHDAAPTGSAATAISVAPSQPELDELDPRVWSLPLICKDCGERFEVPYRHFKAGVVFHCPQCHGSFVPTLPMFRIARDKFESFLAQARSARDELIRRGDQAAARHDLDSRRAAFEQELEQFAREMWPAGKMMKPKGLRAMFT